MNRSMDCFAAGRTRVGALCLLLAMVTPSWSQVDGRGPASRESWQILDEPARPSFEVGMGYVPGRQYGSKGDSSVLEIDGLVQLAYFQNVLLSDVELAAEAELLAFSGSAGIGLPRELIRVALDASMSWRYVNQTALRLGARPGLYSDVGSIGPDAFYLPMSIAGIYQVNSDLSAILGFEMRPGFDRVIFPIVGLGWQVEPRLRVDGLLPESKVSFLLVRDLWLYGSFKWSSLTYAMDGEQRHEAMTIEDYRVALGVCYSFDPELSLVAEFGPVFSRSVTFDNEAGAEAEYDVEAAPLLRIGVLGPF